jgi:cell division initiation protein
MPEAGEGGDMKLTPLDIRHKEFRRGLRGYSDEEVDVFLDEVADEFERFFQENIDLKEQNQRLDEQVAQYISLKETLQKTLISAQQQSDEMRANARKEAELILRDADLKSRDIVNESYSEKQRVQQALIQLKQVEEDFRFKFRSLLEQHLNTLGKDDASEDRRRFHGVVAGMEQAGTPVVKGAPGPSPAAQPSAETAPRPAERKVVFGGAAVNLAAAIPAAARPAAGPTEPSGEVEAASLPPRSADPASTVVPPAAASGPVAAPEPPAPPVAAVPPVASAATEVTPEKEVEDDAPRWLSSEPAPRKPVDAGDPARSGAPAVAFDERTAEEEPTEQGLDQPRKASSVRRFLFGSKDSQGEDDFFSDKEDRDFQW